MSAWHVLVIDLIRGTGVTLLGVFDSEGNGGMSSSSTHTDRKLAAKLRSQCKVSKSIPSFASLRFSFLDSSTCLTNSTGNKPIFSSNTIDRNFLE